MLESGDKCIKWLLFIFNFLFFIAGGGMLGVGIWIEVAGSSFKNAISSNPLIFDAVYVIIAVGAILTVISFFGCCGAANENRCMLGTFFALVLVIFIIQIVGGILAFAFYPKVEQIILESMRDYKPGDSKNSLITLGWDTMQAEFPCCGFKSYEDWQDYAPLTFSLEQKQLVPDSCCVREQHSLEAVINDREACLALEMNSNGPEVVYTTPCEEKIKSFFWIIGGIALGVLIVELLAMIFSCCLYCAVGKEAY